MPMALSVTGCTGRSRVSIHLMIFPATSIVLYNHILGAVSALHRQACKQFTVNSAADGKLRMIKFYTTLKFRPTRHLYSPCLRPTRKMSLKTESPCRQLL